MSRRRDPQAAPSVACGDSSPDNGGVESCVRRGNTILLPRVRGRCPRSGRRGNSADLVIDRVSEEAPSVACDDSSPDNGGAEWRGVFDSRIS